MRGNQLFVYYCKYSGRHVLTTNCDISRAPKRRWDPTHLVLDRTLVFPTHAKEMFLMRWSAALKDGRVHRIRHFEVHPQAVHDGWRREAAQAQERPAGEAVPAERGQATRSLQVIISNSSSAVVYRSSHLAALDLIKAPAST